MGNFQGGGSRGGGFRGGNGGGGRPSFGGNRGGGDRGPVTMHKAVCDECHKSCEVPFRPSGDKPIYCNDCFSSKRDDGDRAPRREFSSDRAPRREFNDRPAPSQSSSFAKPVAGANDDVKRQLSEMNSKLDRLINGIEKLAGPKQVAQTPVMKVAAPVVAKAPVAKIVTKAKVVAKAPAKKIVKKGKK